MATITDTTNIGLKSLFKCPIQRIFWDKIDTETIVDEEEVYLYHKVSTYVSTRYRDGECIRGEYIMKVSPIPCYPTGIKEANSMYAKPMVWLNGWPHRLMDIRTA